MANVDVLRIVQNLDLLNNPSDTASVKGILAKVMSLHVQGFDVSEALPKIVKLLANQDLVVKKALYNILTTYSFSDPDVILLATNTLVQECSDSNPMVRGLAIKTICSFNHETFLEYGTRSVVAGLKDSSAYVRRASVLGCGQLNLRSNAVCQEHGFVDHLYRSIRDTDPVVMVNAIMVLEEILKNEGGIVINKNIAHFVLTKIESLSSWGMSYIFQILQKYQPKSEDEMFDILNILDPFLTHNNNSVATDCFELFLHFIKGFPTLKPEVYKRCFGNMVTVIRSANPEVIFCILELFEKHIEDAKTILEQQYEIFVCKSKEPVYLKLKKINFMRYVLTEDNVMNILEEMRIHTTDSDIETSLSSLNVIAVIYQNYPAVTDKCQTIFKQLLQSHVSHVISNCLLVLQKIDLSKTENCSDFIAILCQSLDFVNDENGKCALLTLLGNYGDSYSETPYVLEDFIENNENMTAQVKVHLLYCSLKMFFHYPPVCQHMLGKVFEICANDKNECLQDMSAYYYSLLNENVEDAKHVIMNCREISLNKTHIPADDNKL